MSHELRTLGLAIAKKIVEMHAARIQPTGLEPPEEASFRGSFTFPLQVGASLQVSRQLTDFATAPLIGLLCLDNAISRSMRSRGETCQPLNHGSVPIITLIAQSRLRQTG